MPNIIKMLTEIDQMVDTWNNDKNSLIQNTHSALQNYQNDAGRRNIPPVIMPFFFYFAMLSATVSILTQNNINFPNPNNLINNKMKENNEVMAEKIKTLSEAEDKPTIYQKLLELFSVSSCKDTHSKAYRILEVMTKERASTDKEAKEMCQIAGKFFIFKSQFEPNSQQIIDDITACIDEIPPYEIMESDKQEKLLAYETRIEKYFAHLENKISISLLKELPSEKAQEIIKAYDKWNYNQCIRYVNNGNMKMLRTHYDRLPYDSEKIEIDNLCSMKKLYILPESTRGTEQEATHFKNSGLFKTYSSFDCFEEKQEIPQRNNSPSKFFFHIPESESLSLEIADTRKEATKLTRAALVRAEEMEAEFNKSLQPT